MLPRPDLSPPPRRTGLVASFRHAIRGVVDVAAHERNMKLHLCAGVAVALVGAQVDLPVGARLALVVCVALVVAGEALNSALEALVDLHTREFRHEARRVKDAAAGVVLVLAAGAVITGTVVLGESGAAFVDAVRRAPWLAAVDLVVLGCTAGLLFLRAGWLAWAACGAAGIALVAVRGVSVAFAVMAAALFAVAVGAARVMARER